MGREMYINAIEERILKNGRGNIYIISDFLDITNYENCKKALLRLEEAGLLRRVLRGVYDYPEYSELLKENIAPDIDKIAKAIARNYGWSIAPIGDIALNRLGLSSQVPNVWSYVSDGPYRAYEYKKITIKFSHRANKEISSLSEISSIVVHALKTLGQSGTTEEVLQKLRNRISEEEKKRLLEETSGTTKWIYESIRKICEG